MGTVLANDIRGTAMRPLRPERANDVQTAIVSVMRGVLAHHRDTPRRIEHLVALDPGVAMGHAVRGLALCLQMRTDLAGTIAGCLLRAEVALRERGGCETEIALTSALEAYAGGRPHEALGVMDAHLAAIPFDLLTLKIDHALHFLIGDTAGMRRAVDAAVAALPLDFPWRSYALGCQAFARIESGDVEGAERSGREAVEAQPDDAWGVHAVAHAMTTAGRARESIAWLRGCAAALQDVNNFGGHLAWHEALALFALGHDDAALDVYDTRIVVHLAGDYRDVVNAATLLHRFRVRGHDVRDRAARLAAHVAQREGDHGTAFGDVHHVIALGEHDAAIARGFAGSMRIAANERHTHEAKVAREVACDLADAIVALREGRPAAHLFEATRAGWPRLGGSHIQREAFQSLLDEALAARALLEGD